MKKTVLIINTGGTIGMTHTDKGDKPEAGLLVKLLEKLPSLTHPDMPNYNVIEYSPLIDSSDSKPQHWNRIARDIYENYDQYDGFIIIHGTDTMAYTASALSFMLENLNKPVILTGSLIPLMDVRNDARDNLVNAMYLASHFDINEVCLYFHDALLRGNRSKKISSISYDAFKSPNFPALAKLGTRVEIKSKLLLPKPQTEFSITEIKDVHISNVKLFPGISIDYVKYLSRKSAIQALILGTYGIGNAPNDEEFLNVLKDANDRNIILVNCTQCHHGYVDMRGYATGKTLEDIGVISVADMTFEAVVTKLYYLFSCSYNVDEIKQKMQQNIRGELTKLT